MKKVWDISREEFDRLLRWLDADRDNAGRKYEGIRLRLIKIFTCRGCSEAEDLADETINRVTIKLQDISENYSGDPALYFYGVAQKIHLEYLRQMRPRPAPPPPVVEPDVDEQEFECLDQCLNRLPGDNRRLVLEYYQDIKRAKIDHRRRLAEQLGIAVNALRIRAHRIRSQLQQCVTGCLAQKIVK
jgi:DNA-directed RNA polymerase specialized sigma24 family protein